MLEVGGLRFELDRAGIHQTGDYLIYLDKNSSDNASEGMLGTGGFHIKKPY